MKKSLFLLPILLCSACSFNGSLNFNYKDADKYTVGNFHEEASITTLNVDYLYGDITISYTEDNYVSVTETTDIEINKDVQMRYYLNDATLNIQPAEPGIRDYTKAKRELNITVPYSTSLENLNINVMSSKMKIDVDATNFTIDTVSGNFEMTVREFKKINVNSVSGNGEIMLAKYNDAKVKFESLSGKLTDYVEGTNEDHLIAFHSVSGNLTVDKLIAPAN